MPVIILVAVVVVLLIDVFFVIGVYNSLQRRRLGAQTAWSDIDVQLKRRTT